MQLLGEQEQTASLQPRLPTKRWTRSEALVLAGMDLLGGRRYELVNGELIDKMGKLRPHVIATKSAVAVLEDIFGRDFVQWEAPIDVAAGDNEINEPEPDIFVLRRSFREIRQDNPQPEDIVLVVEVADSSLAQDRTVKARLYARAGIPEYWISNVRDRRLLVFRDPLDGLYRTEIAFDENEPVSPTSRPESMVKVASLLP